MSTSTSTFADRIIQLKDQYGSYDILARELKVSSTAVARWCRGERGPDVGLDMLRHIADTLHIGANWLIGRQTSLAGIDMVLLEQILTIVANQPKWISASAKEKLHYAVKIYDASLEGELSEQSILRLLESIRRRPILLTSNDKSGPR